MEGLLLAHVGTHEEAAVAYVRPHDVQLARISSDNGTSIEAIVRDVRPVGALARLELERLHSAGVIEPKAHPRTVRPAKIAGG